MREPSRKELRCAIYTRKSSEEGLEQDFNSLHAQREACEAYIKSQKHEGWRVIPASYDDGGYSGGSIERPALVQLLADIQAKLVDVVVVYKVDRLTRSLADFAKIVEVFDAKGVSFVSVTQQFNTTSSMGRLTLNVLLSFAQFEREVTGERIRDKIAASKKKGLWMGGFVPFGYRANERTLIIHNEEAETLRTIFRLYLACGSVLKVATELARRGLRTRPFRSATNKAWGDRPFSRGHIYTLLSNPIYIGKIAHRGEQYDGQHPAIIDRNTWDAVQHQLASNTRRHDVKARAKEPNLLAGLLVDDRDTKLTSSHTVKDGKRYRYYVGRSDGQSGRRPWRLPAYDIESAVIVEVSGFLKQRGRIVEALVPFCLDASVLKDALASASRFAAELESSSTQQRSALLGLLKVVRVSEHALEVEIVLTTLLPTTAQAEQSDRTEILRVPINLRRQAGETKISVAGSNLDPANINQTLIQQIARGHLWFEEICTGQAERVTDIARREGLTDRYVSRLMEYAFLAPADVENYLNGATVASSQTGLLWGR